MSYKIKFDLLPSGYAMTAARTGDPTVLVETTGFYSTEDGQTFVERLEGIPDCAVRLLPLYPNVGPSDIRDLLVIVYKDCTGTVYLNREIRIIQQIQAKRKIEAGQAVFNDDIADIVGLSIDGVSIPNDAGVVFVFSVGWRRGMFFDLGPVVVNGAAREFDLKRIFAQCYAHVMFQELFRIPDSVWDTLFSQHWFPFRALQTATIRKMLSHAKEGWLIDDLIDDISKEVEGSFDAQVEAWKRNPVFSEHLFVLTSAVDRFRNQDYVSATALLFPRIEGVLRSFHRSKGETTHPSQGTLAKSAVESSNGPKHARCLLLPERFERYLREVYFANFDPSDSIILASRHSVAHGVGNQFDKKSALVAFLIVQQISYYCATP